MPTYTARRSTIGALASSIFTFLALWALMLWAYGCGGINLPDTYAKLCKVCRESPATPGCKDLGSLCPPAGPTPSPGEPSCAPAVMLPERGAWCSAAGVKADCWSVSSRTQITWAPGACRPEPELPPVDVCHVDVDRACGCWHRPPGEPWQAAPACPTPPLPTPHTPHTPLPESCPASPIDGRKYINTRCITSDPGATGCAKLDSTPRVDGEFCGRATGDPTIRSCKANPEGSGFRGCDTEFLGAPCPIWQRANSPTGPWERCLEHDGDVIRIACDHFDQWDESRPYTGRCQLNVDENPIAGFYVVAHGLGFLRACTADASVCSDPVKVDH